MSDGDAEVFYHEHDVHEVNDEPVHFKNYTLIKWIDDLYYDSELSGAYDD